MDEEKINDLIARRLQAALQGLRPTLCGRTARLSEHLPRALSAMREYSHPITPCPPFPQ